jgi:hypothetical protein
VKDSFKTEAKFLLLWLLSVPFILLVVGEISD